MPTIQIAPPQNKSNVKLYGYYIHSTLPSLTAHAIPNEDIYIISIPPIATNAASSDPCNSLSLVEAEAVLEPGF